MLNYKAFEHHATCQPLCTERDDLMKMQGKSVVVTGASSGMGDAIVRLFVAEGAQVVAVARRKERLCIRDRKFILEMFLIRQFVKA